LLTGVETVHVLFASSPVVAAYVSSEATAVPDLEPAPAHGTSLCLRLYDEERIFNEETTGSDFLTFR
jgi:hypothetical protein